MVSLILILTIRGTLFKLSTKMHFSLPLSLHPTVELGKEKEKDCVQIKCKDSVKMKQISVASSMCFYRKCRNIFPVHLHLMYVFFLHNEMLKKTQQL